MKYQPGNRSQLWAASANASRSTNATARFRKLWSLLAISTLLLLGTLMLTVRTVVSFITGSAIVYFAQPMATAVVASIVLVASAALGRPFTQRFAHDFCPLDPELVARPRVQKFFVQISVVWAAVLLLNAGLVLWMLLSSSLKMFVLERTAATWTLTAGAIAISIFGFTAAMRSDDVTVHWGKSARNLPATSIAR